ncbi:demethylrebeccamycin-D-glucose O-methyltransferase [Colletotrichum spaethianum]|uniref:Demethylrebeccamycin-D-glucose O-methyltransferase n=1 Tax=Colletotrichum spaethianum TaxID=700344 RepID=A0AA37NYE7_9PEZI|nr:demethylrebeccamycin-D-glucose O-methyltransferase [Colletotrichum spaethianum]GKT46162.1 demethylrebeccamycin-D-glucose O-methyltransferase [Colletotrichum spaethianum]
MASSTTATETEPLINPNPTLQSYYASLESRIGYRLVLGGTRHFGYWERDTYWPFPVSRSLRRMEDKMAEVLDLPKGATVLDAGCGNGHVARHLAGKHGLKIEAFDVVERHVQRARKSIKDAGLEASVTVNRRDYHHLESLADQSFDGIYTMETLVHATDPESVLAGFYRLLKPGGHISNFEYDHHFTDGSPSDMVDNMRKINEWAAMPTNDRSNPGVFKQLLEEAGFVDVQVRDFSENIRPLCRLFFLLGIVPYLFIKFFGLEKHFINTVAGVETYRGKGRWRYVAISARKPGGTIEAPKSR